jgi:AcrR family transcriptional regulator
MSLSPADPPPRLEDPPRGPFALRISPRPGFLSARGLGVRDRFPREVLDRNHRNRILTGAVAAVAEYGYPNTSTEQILAAAGVSRHVFYRQFPDKELCLLAAYDRAIDWLEEEVRSALPGDGQWSGQVRAATVRALALVASAPALARLLTTEILCIGVPGQMRRRELIDRLTPLLRVGRAEAPDSAVSTPNLERFLVHGAIAAVGREVSAGRGECLADFAPDLTEFLLVPYLGHARARRVARAGSRSSTR